jgi:AcrR family transcriptional regulator
MVRKTGFEAVSIANLAREVGMSKSGLFAHFNSKEKMHVMILDHAALAYNDEVLAPAIKLERGLPRLETIVKKTATWNGCAKKGGCPFVTAAVEYDSRPGAVRDRVQLHLGNLIKVLTKAIQICVEEKHLKKTTNKDQLAFEIYSIGLGSMVFRKTLMSPQADKYLEKGFKNTLRGYLV